MPLAKGGGLPGLKGAKIQLIFADNQGTPAAGQNQALRLISEEKVAALIGAYQSGITLTASAIAERHGIPFLTAELVAANLTERGFKWFFRTTPVAIDFARAYSDVPARSRRRPARRSARSRWCTRTPSTATRWPASSPSSSPRTACTVTPEDRLLGQLERRAAAGAAAQGEESRRR